jgi:hypothetical protein
VDAGPVLGLPAVRPALLVDIPAAESGEAQGRRAGIVNARLQLSSNMNGYIRCDDDDEPDFEDEDEEFDDEDGDEDEEEEEDDDGVERWQVTGWFVPCRKLPGRPSPAASR